VNLMIPGDTVGNVSLFVYHVCGEGHFLTFSQFVLSSRFSVFLHWPLFLEKFRDISAL